FERSFVGIYERTAARDAAGIGVLDDRNGGAVLRIELRDQFECRVGIVQVVVAQLLALKLRGGGDAEALLAGDIECRVLMRVFAIAQRLLQLAAERAIGRRLAFQLLGVPSRDRRIVRAG